MSKRSAAQRIKLQLPTTIVRPGISTDYGTPVYVVYWAHEVTEEEQHKHDPETGEHLMDETDNPIYETVTFDRPQYREERLSEFPTLPEAYAHAATVREMRYG